METTIVVEGTVCIVCKDNIYQGHYCYLATYGVYCCQECVVSAVEDRCMPYIANQLLRRNVSDMNHLKRKIQELEDSSSTLFGSTL
jgi:hypothetical protein